MPNLLELLEAEDIPPAPPPKPKRGELRWKGRDHVLARETNRAKRAYLDYVALGPSRSVHELHRQYKSAPRKTVPSTNWDTLLMWYRNWKWDKRISDILDEERKIAEGRDTSVRKEIMESGVALAHERVRILKAMADKIETVLKDDSIPVSKLTSLLKEYRSILDDIAKEQGHRKLPADALTKDNKPTIVIHSNIPRPGDTVI